MQKHKASQLNNTEPKIIIVSDAMRQAGAELIQELSNEKDAGYLAAAIYLAMEYERLDH